MTHRPKAPALPVEDSVLTSPYGYRTHPVTGELDSFHVGIDLGGVPMGTPVKSVTCGTVRRIDQDGLGKGRINGWAIWVRDPQGRAWAYLHLAKRPTLKVGDVVHRGDVVGLLGSSGRSTGPHLHLSVYIGGKHVDPWPLLMESQNV